MEKEVVVLEDWWCDAPPATEEGREVWDEMCGKID